MDFILSFIEGNSFSFQWEVDLMVWLQKISGDFVTEMMKVFSAFGEELIMIAVLGFLYWGLDKKFGEFVGFSLLFTNTLNPLIKNIANRRRPYMDHEGIECLKLIEEKADKMDIAAQGFSFPSGHSSGSAAVYTALPFYGENKKRKWLIAVAVVLPFIVGLSRVFLGVHYPTDVLAGWALGLGIVVLMSLLLRVVRNKYWIYLASIVLATAGMFYCNTNDYFTSYGMLVGFVAGIFFEEKVTKFQNTKVWWRIILRLVVGGALYLGLNALLKLPMELIMGEEWMEVASAGNFAFRAIRYAVILFLLIGVYPLLFKVFDKVWVKLKFIKEPQKPSYYREENKD